MPTEFRRLVFSNNELRDAIEGYIPKSGESLPTGPVRECHVSEDLGVEVIIVIESEEDGTLRKFKMSTFFLSAALLEYCREHQVPIPRDANKYLEVVGDCLALRITLRSASARFEEPGGATPALEEL